MEYLVSYIIWSIACFGASIIIVNSSLFLPLREFLLFSKRKYNDEGTLIAKVRRNWKFPGKLISCNLCMGFWVGVFFGLTVWAPFAQSGANLIIQSIFNGCLGAMASWIPYLFIADKMRGK